MESLDEETFNSYANAMNYEYYTYNNYNDEYLEEFYDEYTTKSGETIVAFGKYGYDG